jgi:ligand-binding sensor domain-containing protein/signal transduction histidine kinase
MDGTMSGTTLPIARPSTWRRAARSLACIYLAAAIFVDLRSARAQNAELTARIRTHRPADRITAVVADGDGWIWVGTDIGLCRFDGLTCVFQDYRTAFGSEIRTLAIGMNNALWVGATSPTSIWTVDDQRKSLLPVPGSPVKAMAIDATGQMWIGTEAGLERRRADGNAEPVDLSALSDRKVHSLCKGQGGRMWVGTASGLGFVDRDGKVRSIWKGDTVHAISAIQTGHIWLATEHRGLVILDSETGVQTSIPGTWQGLDPTVLSIHTTSKGDTWIGTGSGLVSWKDGRFTQILRGAELPAVRIGSITSDREGNLWLGTDGGGLVQILPPRPFVPIALQAGEIAFTIASDNTGDVWLNLGTSLVRVRGSDVKRYVAPDALNAYAMRPMVAATGGGVWVASESLFRVRDGNFAKVPLPEVPAGHSIRTLHQSGDDTLWIGFSPSGVAEHRRDHTTFYPGASIGCDEPPTAILEDSTGKILVATDGAGLCVRERGQPFHAVRPHPLSPQMDLTAMTLDRDGAAWFGTRASGLVRWKNNQWSILERDQGVPTHAVGAILFGEGDFAWVTTRSGVLRFNRQDLNRIADGKPAKTTAAAFGVDDGLPSNDCLWGWPNPSIRDANGQLWISTLKGVAILKNPEQLAFPPLVNLGIDRTLFDGRPQRPDKVREISQPAGRGNVEIHYGIPAKAERQRVRYRYRLSGIENDWVPAHDRQTAYYTNLAPGNYLFSVQAYYPGDNAPPAESTMRFILAPPFVQTRTFYALCVSLLTIVVIAIFRIRRRQITLSAHALHQERGRIAQEIHDTLEQTFVATKFQIEAAMRNVSETSAAQGQLHRARELLSKAMTETRAAIWSLRARETENRNLTNAVAVAVGESVQGSDLTCQVSATGTVFPLPANTHDHILRIVRSAIANVCKHAKASSIEVSLAYSADAVTLSVEDNGVGFDATSVAISEETGHWGLSGMRERARALGGTLELKTPDGGGTEIVLRIPRKHRPLAPELRMNEGKQQ